MVFQKSFFKIWGIISAIFIVTDLVFLYLKVWTVFFTMLNLTNLTLFVFSFLARKQLNKAVNKIVDLYKNFEVDVSRYQVELDTHAARNAGKVFIYFLIVISLYFCYVAVVNWEHYYWLIHEDNIVEAASAFCWFATVIVLLTTFIRYVKQGHLYFITLTLYGGMALFAFLCGGEEISWGQRILNIETPEMLKQINVQSETNLHNIGSISIFSNAFFLITLIFFLAFPKVVNRYAKDKVSLKYFLPVANSQTVIVFLISLAVWIVIGIRFGTLGFHPFTIYKEAYYNQMDDEIFEFMAAYSFLCFSVTDRFKKIKN